MSELEPQFNPQEIKTENPEPRKFINTKYIQESETNIVFSAPAERGSSEFFSVRLDKAQIPSGDPFEQYADVIIEEEFAMLLRDVAVSFDLGNPPLVEGPTSFGKTTAVKYLCSLLGWEVHYANLNGATDVEDLMGRYIPNPQKNKPEDPEYIFADGKVTSGLRQEDGKVKVVILDEFNASAPNILIRLHEVLDALERGGDVVLSEDASEAVSTNNKKTKVIALMNPPGKGYFGREPLDPAQLRRWVYKKLPSKLPDATFSYATDALFGFIPEESQNSNPVVSPQTWAHALSTEQFAEIHGISDILIKYKEFHKASIKLLEGRKLAEDQPQPFNYDDRMEPRRVRDFVLRFYHGDINETFQQALRYYYANKLENDIDRKKLEELIKLVEYKPTTQRSKRKNIEKKGVKSTSPTGEKKREGIDKTTLEHAKQIMGDNFFGKQEIKDAFGFEIIELDIPPIPYSPEVLEKAYELGEFLVLRVGHDAQGKPMTMERINLIMEPRFDDNEKQYGRLYGIEWYKDEDFYKNAPLKTEWKLVGGSFVPDMSSEEDEEGNYSKDSRGNNYIHQTRLLRDYLKSVDSLTEDEELECSDDKLRELSGEMGVDWDSQEITDESKYNSKWKVVAAKLAKLTVNANHRRSPTEIMYDYILQFKKTEDSGFLGDNYDWSSTLSSDGDLVFVGSVGADGALVRRWLPGYRVSDVGVVSLR